MKNGTMKAGRISLFELALGAGLALGPAAAYALPTVTLSFDDGLVTSTTAQQLLDAHGMKGTFYVCSGLFETAPDYYLDVPHTLAIQAAGHEIGGHSITHLNLAPEYAAPPSAEEQRHQICDSRAQLLGLGFSPVVSFAYPYGAASAAIQDIVKGCGYTSGRGAWNRDPVTGGSASNTEIVPVSPATGGDPYWIRTPASIVNTTTLADMKGYVTEAENVPGGAGWVVFLIHFVCADSDSSCNQNKDSVSAGVFNPFLDWLQGRVSASAVAVKTVGEVMGGFHTPPAPAIFSLTPSSAATGGAAFTLAVEGTGFVDGANVLWDGAARATTFGSSTTLTAQITAGDLATQRTVLISVANPDAVTSPEIPFKVTINPVPVLTALSSTFTAVGNAAFTLTATGSDFVSDSVIRWNGSARSTTLVNSTTLTARILASDLETVKIASVTVFNAGPGGGESGSRPFTVLYAAPSLETVSPALVNAGGAAFTLTVTGHNFYSSSILKWNDLPVGISSFTATRLTAVIPADRILLPGEATIAVFTPLPGGGTSSLPGSVGIAAGGDGSPGCNIPALTALEPASVPAGTPDFTLTVRGGNFYQGSTIRWNGSPKPTAFVNSGTMTAAISAGDVPDAGPVKVTVFTGGPGGGASGELPLSVGSSSVRVHPNPWKAGPHTGRPLVFDELPAGSTVKIFTVSGHWVRTLSAPQGFVNWDLKAEGGSAVASGYYLYLVTSPHNGRSRGVLGIIR